MKDVAGLDGEWDLYHFVTRARRPSGINPTHHRELLHPSFIDRWFTHETVNPQLKLESEIAWQQSYWTQTHWCSFISVVA